MRMKLAYFLIFLSIICLIIYLLPRLSSFLMDGKTGHSGGIRNSKELNVFICEYSLNKEMIELNDSLKFSPGEIWLEKIWSQGSDSEPVKISDRNKSFNYWLLIEIPKDKVNAVSEILLNSKTTILITDHFETFWIRKSGDKYFLIATYKDIPIDGETIKVIQKSDSSEQSMNPNKWRNPIVIDKIKLFKKVMIK